MTNRTDIIDTITASDVMDFLRATDAKGTAAWQVALFVRGIITLSEFQTATKTGDDFDIINAFHNLQVRTAAWIAA